MRLPERPLHDALAALAGSPDDISGIDELLVRIAALTVASVECVDYASVTAQRDGAPTTVALSNETALAIDEAQYAHQEGPCLEALEVGLPVGVVIASTMEWPGFRQAAASMGVQASLSLPLIAGSGQAIAALNLYARDSDALAPLTKAFIRLFADMQSVELSNLDPAHTRGLGQDAGSLELVTGMAEAFAIQHHIHVAVGALMQRLGIDADRAYVVLREQSATTGDGLLETAAAVLAKLAQD